MAMHDIDKSSGKRLRPTVNVPDAVKERMAHNTYGNTYRDASVEVVQRNRIMNGLILTYDEENRVSSVYGYIPELSATPVQIIANEGYDVFEDLLNIDPPVV